MNKTVFVSGCYDPLHAGHIDFLKRAAALGDRLVVHVANDDVIREYKRHEPLLPEAKRAEQLLDLKFVDAVGIGFEPMRDGIDFEHAFLEHLPDILCVTDDDKFEVKKRELCAATNAQYVKLPKGDIAYSSTKFRGDSAKIPSRVDFAGGWLGHKEADGHKGLIVSCTVTPFYDGTNYEQSCGMATSTMWELLNGRDPRPVERALNGGWQDACTIMETGLVVWKSGTEPDLQLKTNGQWLRGHMAVVDTGMRRPKEVHAADPKRNFERMVRASYKARDAVHHQSMYDMQCAVHWSYMQQLEEGMRELPEAKDAARKYLGAGHGGYALYLFCNKWDREEFLKVTPKSFAVEPFCRN